MLVGGNHHLPTVVVEDFKHSRLTNFGICNYEVSEILIFLFQMGVVMVYFVFNLLKNGFRVLILPPVKVKTVSEKPEPNSVG